MNNYDYVQKVTKDLCNIVLKLYGSNRQCPDNIIKLFCESGFDTLNDYLRSLDDEFVIKRFKHLDDKDEYYRNRCDIITVPKQYKKLWNTYKLIEIQPQYEQKSKEWLAQRQDYITASAGAQAIGESKYESAFELLIAKVGLGKPFKENMHVHHGKKLESIATIIYEHINNVKIGEFGLIPHLPEPRIPFLSASPDGICTCTTLDGEFSPLVGRMLEIKCVTIRKINIKGPEHVLVGMNKKCYEKDTGIVPHYYWIQVQLQLECCDLEECDFWQCKLKNFDTLEELQKNVNKVNPVHTIGQGIVRDIDKNLETGVLIELIPKDTSFVPKDEKVEWYGKYIYPDRLDTSMEDKMRWANYMKNNWDKIYSRYKDEYVFNKVLYYHLEQSHCYLVKRDRQWFSDNYPRFKEFWDNVIAHRKDSRLQEELVRFITERELQKQRQEKYIAEQNSLANCTMDSDSD